MNILSGKMAQKCQLQTIFFSMMGSYYILYATFEYPLSQIRSVTIHLFILVKLAHWFHDFATQNKSIIWVEF